MKTKETFDVTVLLLGRFNFLLTYLIKFELYTSYFAFFVPNKD